MTAWALVVVHHRDPAAVAGLLASVVDWTARPVGIVVVDNSGDLPDVAADVVPAAWNPGYAAAGNLGAQRVRERWPQADLVLLCTQDARLDPRAAERLVAAADADPAIGLAGPVLAFRSDPGRTFSNGGALNGRGEATHLGRGAPVSLARRVDDVDWLDGAINLVRLDALTAIGGWDESYFLYVEEVDLQWRLRAAGHRVVIVRDALGAQEPGAYPPFLRFRNSVHFTAKFADRFRPWPWRRQLVREVAKGALAAAPMRPVHAWRGVRAARRGRMGPP